MGAFKVVVQVSVDDVLRIAREEIVKVMDPNRLKMETRFEAAGEAHRLVMPGG
jgi:hypothetical protein